MAHDCPQCQAATGHTGKEIVQVRDARLSFGATQVLRGVNLNIPKGEIVALIGPNGSGKTTLLRSLLGLQKLDAGDIRLFGQPISTASLCRVGYVPQKLMLERSFALSVREFLALRLKQTRHWFWQSRETIADEMRPLLVEIGVETLLERPVASL